MNQQTIAPVVKELEVRCSIETAFETFTARIADWWPLATHSVGGAGGTVRTEPGPDGRFVETTADGVEHVWGEITSWDPPRRFVSTWHPGHEAGTASELEITFEASTAGTVVRLVHRNWEHLGERASATRENYHSGWDVVLADYVAAAST